MIFRPDETLIKNNLSPCNMHHILDNMVEGTCKNQNLMTHSPYF
jgi:hypothetical protein